MKSHLVGIHTGGRKGFKNYGTFIKSLSIQGLKNIFTSQDPSE